MDWTTPILIEEIFMWILLIILLRVVLANRKPRRDEEEADDVEEIEKEARAVVSAGRKLRR
jgi:hypothetical protein